jgi:hypothetical protein
MKIKYALLFTAALAAANSLQAQKVTDKDITFDFKRLPLEPLGTTFTTYQTQVQLNYLAENAAKKAEYEKQLKEADGKYEADMAEWKIKDKEAEAKYQKDLEVYNKKSGAQKLIEKKMLEEGKPVKQYVSQPSKNIPTPPLYKKEFDPSLLAASYLKLEGLKNAPENPIKITATISGFEALPPVMKYEQSTVSVNGSASQTSYYETQYKFPMAIKVEVPGKGVILNDQIQKFTQYTVDKTTPNSGFDTQVHLRNLEEKAVSENLKYINDLLNDKYGFVKTNRKVIIYNVEPKKLNYDDYAAAFENAIVGYNMLLDNKTEGTAKIKTAIAAWEKALTEVNLADKKARINEDIALITRLNLAEAYVWVDDFANAEMQLLKLNALDPSRKQKAYAEELSKLMKDQKKRFDVNKSI